MTEPAVMEYDDMDDLEETIDEVYREVAVLDRELDRLEQGVDTFLDTNYVSEEMLEATDYVSKNLPVEALPGIAREYAARELDNPQEAENWHRLEQAEEVAEKLFDRYSQKNHELWGAFGIEGEELQNLTEGIPPIETFFSMWDHNPQRLFRNHDSYEGNRTTDFRNNPGLTIARYFEPDGRAGKQVDDEVRGNILDRETHDLPMSPKGDRERREDIRRKGLANRWLNREKV